jgi:outer membrane protein assembly factor BamB
MMIYFKKFFLVTSFLLFGSSAFADWPNWRGPNFNGSANNEHKRGYPIDFSPTKNVKWSIELDGPSASTPIIIGDNVFLSGTKLSSDENLASALVALCIDRYSGKILWVKDAGSGYQPGAKDGSALQLDSRSNYSSPSPVVSEKYAVFFYGNGDLVCFDYSGKLIWRRNIQQDYGDFCFQWTFSSSPLLFKECIFLPVLQRNEPVHNRGKEDAKSSILCIDLNDGKTIWRQIRDTPARKESRESFSTIIPHEGLLLVAGGDHLTAHNPRDGSEIWRWGTWNPGHKQEWWRLVPSPVVGDNKILVCAPKNAPVYAIEYSNKNEAKLAWDTSGSKEVTSDVPTPLFYDNHFYVLSDLRKNLSKVQPNNGSLIWKVDLPGKYKWRASPSAADGKIYIMNHNAEVLVLDATDGEILHSVKMGDSYDDQTRSSIALSDGQIFIRTNKKLYCIQ